MTADRFLRLSLLLPIVVPFVLVPLAYLVPDTLRYSPVPFLLFPMMALFVGGLPYIVVALVTLWRITGRPLHEQWSVLRWLPVVYAVALFVLGTLFLGFQPGGGDLSARLLKGAELASILASFGAALGFVYVGIASVLFRVLRASGVIQSEDPT